MIKVFLVEDEAILRRGIRDGIRWEEHGFEFVGEAGDGEYAYPLILKAEPDILITDVRMPFMDGLELSRLVKKELPRTKIVILSGYDEFSYAKTGIEIGVSDYLLKPITAEKLIQALRKVADQIRDEREKQRLLERYFASYEKYTEFLDRTDYSGADRKLVGNFLKLGSAEESQVFVDEFFDATGENNYQSLLLRQYIVMDIFYCIQEFLKEIGADIGQKQDLLNDIGRIPGAVNTVETTKRYLTAIFVQALESRDQVSSNRYGSLIEDAKAYIGEHFASSDFSLNTVAGYIGVSPSYFSSIFKQETGQSFINYLTKVRMDKACELLRCTTLRIVDVGERVGYSDSHYFSATFKKVIGKTPKEYKNS
ncbi:MAG: response regulator [Lachnospiraceae bacterium]|nr:response regulator [Lachnospiraceae bacterium]